MKATTFISLFFILAVSCKSSVKPPSCEGDSSSCRDTNTSIMDEQEMEEDYLNWAGTYQGVVPCEGCDGMRISLELREDENYNLRIDYLGSDRETEIYDYIFTWNIRGDIIMLMNEEYDLFEHFQLVEDAAYLLVHNGKEVSKGDGFEATYRINKQKK